MTRKYLLPVFFMLFTLCLPAQQERFSFAVVTDIHLGSNGADEDLRRTIDDINTIDSLQFVIVSGDITEFGADSELRKAKEMLDQLEKPWYIIPGNHDAKWSESGANTFRVVFGGEAFAFRYGQWLFLGTNSGPNMRMGPGQIPRENLVWLDSVLNVPANREMKIISVNHYPLDESLNNWFELTDRLRQLDTRLALCGHGHVNREMNYEGIPALMCRSNLRAGKEYGGYTILTITADTLLTASERTPGVTTLPAWAAVPLVRHDWSADATVWPRPDYSMNKRYSEVREVWRLQENADIGAGAAVAGKLAIITNTAGQVKALSLRKGKTKWSYPTGAKIYSTPAIAGRRVVTASADGIIRALELKSGRLLWSFDAGQRVVASPVIEGGKVFVTGSGGRCQALDLTDGTLLWSNGEIEGFVETIPLIYKGMLIFGTWGNRLYALDTENGETRWVWDTGYTNRMLSPAACVPVAVGNRLFVVSPDRKMACLQPSTGELLWQSDLGGVMVRESMGVTADSSLILAKTMNGVVTGVSSSGNMPEVIWQTGFNIGYDIAPGVVTEYDGIILIPSDKGVVHAASRTNGRLLWSHRISSCLINNIVPLGDGTLLCTSMDGVVARVSY